jgi:hypothetical protein
MRKELPGDYRFDIIESKQNANNYRKQNKNLGFLVKVEKFTLFNCTTIIYSHQY